jgi:hypothetical protein
MQRRYRGENHMFVVTQERTHFETDSETQGSHAVTVLSSIDFNDEKDARERFNDTCRAFEFLGFEPEKDAA